LPEVDPPSTSEMVIPFFLACEYFSLILVVVGCTFLELHPERPNTKPGSVAVKVAHFFWAQKVAKSLTLFPPYE
jgi:hypothetical protein